MEESAIERLQAKSPEEAVVEQISRDFNLAHVRGPCNTPEEPHAAWRGVTAGSTYRSPTLPRGLPPRILVAVLRAEGTSQ